MSEVTSNTHQEKVLLVGVHIKGATKFNAMESLNELELLAKSAGALVKQKVLQIRSSINPKFYLGKGKLEELVSLLQSEKIDTIIFDNELSPIQARNIERVCNCKIIGRVELILDIFARRAKTKEAKLQVEYAQLMYMMPRLVHMWEHLGRIKGGIGFRGPGEKQLESDKQIIKKRISKIKTELRKISTQMQNRRKKRKGQKIVSIVGYTNSGKSTLLNHLAKENVFTQNMLFATLDPTIRRAFVKDDLVVLLVDTVGFIRNLPHQLVVSFKSTLDEIKYSDLLLHVVDITQENIYEQISSVHKVLSELNALSKPVIYVFNKIDIEADTPINPLVLKEKFVNSCFISAKTGEGISKLRDMIYQFYSQESTNDFFVYRTPI